jgi:hypothetical protein
VAREAWSLIPGRRASDPAPAEVPPERDSHAA